jgi:F420-non-reducing hydrogenase iron-sulfur subunit
MAQQDQWQPNIITFLCKWCSYAGADLAGVSRQKYPANVRTLKIPCSGRMDPLFILKALRMGFDGVLVSGCHPGDCHYQTGNYRARRRLAITKKLLENMGVDPRRVQGSWISASEGGKFVDVMNKLVDDIKEIGPNRIFKDDRETDTGKVEAES